MDVETPGSACRFSADRDAFSLAGEGGRNRACCSAGESCSGGGPDIGGTQETDGIEATSINLGGAYPEGVFIAQDGENAPKGSARNFKIVDFRAIKAALAAHAEPND